jgi:hypothetical protein
VNEVIALVLVLVLATSGYAAGRLHAQFSYRLGYRFGYRQGYFDGDRSSWNRRRKEMQAAVASVLKVPPVVRARAYPPATAVGTTYTSALYGEEDDVNDLDEPLEPAGRRMAAPLDPAGGRHAMDSWAFADAAQDL